MPTQIFLAFIRRCSESAPRGPLGGCTMRAWLIGAVLIGMAVPLPACAEDNLHSTANFLKHYANEEMWARMYIRGLGDGFSVSNATLGAAGVAPLYCPPEKVGIVDAQYVAIIKSFLAKYPKVSREIGVEVVLMTALQDAFPCK